MLLGCLSVAPITKIPYLASGVHEHRHIISLAFLTSYMLGEVPHPLKILSAQMRGVHSTVTSTFNFLIFAYHLKNVSFNVSFMEPNTDN